MFLQFFQCLILTKLLNIQYLKKFLLDNNSALQVMSRRKLRNLIKITKTQGRVSRIESLPHVAI